MKSLDECIYWLKQQLRSSDLSVSEIYYYKNILAYLVNIKQLVKERNTAITQLIELGHEFGEE